MAPRRFEGWEPKRYTTVTAWDDEGRPQQMTTVSDPEWDAEDRAILHAVMDMRADQCPGCGEPLSETLRVAGRPDPKYTGMVSVCVSCEAKERCSHILDEADTQREASGLPAYRGARHWLMQRLE